MEPMTERLPSAEQQAAMAHMSTASMVLPGRPAGSFASVANGTYSVAIRDAAHTACISILDPALVISQPAALAATLASTNVTCNGANDGTITISGATGGYGTYEYSINGTTWQASGSFADLAPATYNVQIRDAAHTACISILDPALVISQPAALAATLASTNVTCNGANDDDYHGGQQVVTAHMSTASMVLPGRPAVHSQALPTGPIV